VTSAAFGLLTLGLLVPSIVLHEVAHGWVSLRLGDPTARNAGRLSLNPLRHIDLFGTVLLPLMLWSSGAPVFGYAKPVPINPAYYRDVRRGQLRASLAGPAANLLLAGAGSAAAWLAWTLGARDCRPLAWAWLFAGAFVEVNLVLMFFNLIPIPPLDGSSIVPLFLSDSALPTYYRLQRYAFPLLLVVCWGVPALSGVDPIGAYLRLSVPLLFNVLVPQ